MKTNFEEILRNRILDITHEYKGIKRDEGVQVYLGSPQSLIDELNKCFADTILKAIGENEGDSIETDGISIKRSTYEGAIRNNLRSKIKANVFAELGIKEKA